jgi:hypothetical protein
MKTKFLGGLLAVSMILGALPALANEDMNTNVSSNISGNASSYETVQSGVQAEPPTESVYEAMLAQLQRSIANHQARIQAIMDKGNLTEQDQDQIKLLVHQMQTTFDMTAQIIQAMNDMVQPIDRDLRGSVANAPSVNFEDLQTGYHQNAEKIQAKIQELKDRATDGRGVDTQAMYELQIVMQTGSQYIEACSSVLSAVHQAMMSMAKATKGQ